jgi:hypothetical protein
LLARTGVASILPGASIIALLDDRGVVPAADFVVNLAWDRPSRTYNSKDLATANAFKLIPDDV